MSERQGRTEDLVGQELLKRIDKQLPRKARCSLGQWCAQWHKLNEASEHVKRDHFALTGHYEDSSDGVVTRSELDFHDHHVPDQVAPAQHCDVDSVIGTVKGNFPIAGGFNLKYFMLLSPSHTLDTPTRVPAVEIKDEHGLDLRVDPHRIPNGRFLEMENHTLIQICFPRLERGLGESNCLRENELRLFFNRAVRPAAESDLPQELTNAWPGEWDSEKYRAEDSYARHAAQGEGGGHGKRVQHSERIIHSSYLNDWVRRIRELVNACPELDWARSFFFMVEMRGLKTMVGSIHQPPEQQPILPDGDLDPDSGRVQAVESVLAAWNTEEFEPDEWFIDIGLNFALPHQGGGSSCPLPSVEAHALLLSHVLGCNVATCMNWITAGNAYQRDELMHLRALAGFRFTNPRYADNGICYVQLYLSDKSVIYNVTLPGHAKRVNAWWLLQDWDGGRQHHFIPLLDAFRIASETHQTYMRLEVRVEFHQYPFVQYRVPDDIARSWMFFAEPKDYWGWKICRLRSIYSMLGKWISARHTILEVDIPTAGSLFATLVWMANALVNRPDDGGTWTEIRNASSVHRVSGVELVPCWLLHAHFLHSLTLEQGKAPKLSGQRTVSVPTLLYIFSNKLHPITKAALHDLMTRSPKTQTTGLETEAAPELRAALAVYPRASSNRQTHVKTMVKPSEVDLFADLLPAPPVVDQALSEDEDYEERPRPIPLSRHLTDIVCNYPAQIFKKAPAQAGNLKSWCALAGAEGTIQADAFSRMDMLERAFPSHILWGSDVDRWDAIVAMLFPTWEEFLDRQKKNKKKIQGLSILQAHLLYIQQLRNATPDLKKQIAQVTRAYVNEHWCWLPYGVTKNHLWATGQSNVGRAAIHVGSIPGGPWIVCNPRFV